MIIKGTKFTCALSILFLAIFLTSSPGIAAGPYLTTGFVPELATPTADLFYSYHDDQLGGFDLKKTIIGARFSYVPYPAIECSVNLDVLSYELENFDENGLGLGVGLKYQLVQFFQNVDSSINLTGKLGNAGSIKEYDLTIAALISRDVGEGFTPFGGAGISYNRQKFDGEEGLAPVTETNIDPVIFVGIKYMFMNHMGLMLETFLQDGLGLELALGYRF